MSARFWVEATGVCMWPAVREGDLLLCEPLGHTAPGIGDVLVAQEGGGWVAHRLRALQRLRGEERLILKADLGGPDRSRRREEILGHVVLIYRQTLGLTEVPATLSPELDIGPFGAALLRRIARWHGLARTRNARNRGGPHLESSNDSPPRPPDSGHLARAWASIDGGLRDADFPRST